MSPGVAPFSSVFYKRRWSRAPASISSSFSPMITPRRRDLHPTLGAHVGAPLPPRGWHFPCRSRPARRRPLRSHGGTTGSCSRISYIRLTISTHCDKFMEPAPPLWLKPMGRNAVEESPVKRRHGKTRCGYCAARKVERCIYLRDTKGCRYRSTMISGWNWALISLWNFADVSRDVAWELERAFAECNGTNIDKLIARYAGIQSVLAAAKVSESFKTAICMSFE